MMPKHADEGIWSRRRGRVAGHRNRHARLPQIPQLAIDLALWRRLGPYSMHRLLEKHLPNQRPNASLASAPPGAAVPDPIQSP
jgi:hypothetical protein